MTILPQLCKPVFRKREIDKDGKIIRATCDKFQSVNMYRTRPSAGVEKSTSFQSAPRGILKSTSSRNLFTTTTFPQHSGHTTSQ